MNYLLSPLFFNRYIILLYLISIVNKSFNLCFFGVSLAVCDLKFRIYLVGLNVPTLDGGSYLLLEKGVINMSVIRPLADDGHVS